MKKNVYYNDIWAESRSPGLRRFHWYDPPGRRLLMKWGGYGIGPADTRHPFHDHDFYEFFWVVEGTGTHLINGQAVEQKVGDAIFIRPRDVHGFDLGPNGEPWSWINVTIAAPAMRGLARRYADEVARWPWTDERMPRCLRLDTDSVDRLSRRITALPVDSPRRRDLDGLITLLLDLIEPSRGLRPAHPEPCPIWLTAALRAMDQPQHLAEGLPALVRLCGRCPEHVNRVIRQHFNVTATEAVNRRRLDYAARQLRMSRASVLEVAQDSGFDNLSYFHRRFRQRFSQTPRRYRLQQGTDPTSPAASTA